VSSLSHFSLLFRHGASAIGPSSASIILFRFIVDGAVFSVYPPVFPRFACIRNAFCSLFAIFCKYASGSPSFFEISFIDTGVFFAFFARYIKIISP